MSATGEEYRVKYNSNDLGDLIVYIEWKFISNVLAMVKVYTEDLKNCISSKGDVVKNNRTVLTLSDVFNTCSSSEYDYKCLISVLPYGQFQNILASTNSALNQNLLYKKWPVTEKRLNNLSLDIQGLFNRSYLSDVVVTDGSAEINAHKFILSARSPVFDKMFQHNSKENRENRVFISDLSVDVLKEMILFMYTGVVAIKDVEMAQDLYVAADKYDILDLKSLCSSLMQNNLTLDSVLHTLVLSCLIENRDLKICALEFIARNYSDLKKREGWNALVKENGTLVIEILNFVMEKRLGEID